jgi:hypothetical protein
MAVFQSANELISYLLQQTADQIDRCYQAKPGWHCKGRVPLQLQCIFGQFLLQRDYYYEPQSRQGHYPVDAVLALEGGCTPALVQLVCLEALDQMSYQKAEIHLRETGGIEFSARQIQRLVHHMGPAIQKWFQREGPVQQCDALIMYLGGDGTGVPMRRAELLGRKGRQPDGTSKTRQVYLGCVFTQHKCDADGHPMRDYASTSYVSTFESIESFGLLLRAEARRRGIGQAGTVVLLIDGANGLANMGRQNFAHAVQIVDFYHTLEHVGTVLEALLGKEHPKLKAQRRRWTRLLLRDGVERLISETRQDSEGTERETAVAEALHYFQTNVERMQYGTFRKLGYFIGSGVVEAGCKTVIGARCKQSGMFWSTDGAGYILGLRCIRLSGQWNQFWKARANELAAANDALNLPD